jgi:hypothetical protein
MLSYSDLTLCSQPITQYTLLTVARTKLIPAKMFLPVTAAGNTNQDTDYILKMAPVTASKTTTVFSFSMQHIFCYKAMQSGS